MSDSSFIDNQYEQLRVALNIQSSQKVLPLPEFFKPKKILIVAPHPDDECLMAALALRAQEELGSQVFVYAYSFGSLEARREARKRELKNACQVLGFQLVDANSVEVSLNEIQPDCVIYPTEADVHATHVRCSKDTQEAMRRYEASAKTPILRIETEFWGINVDSNLLIEVPLKQAKKIYEALKCHQGEINRNPYHLRLPAYWSDQVRRGSERKALGQVAASIVFGQCYSACITR